ncbi:MAG: flap endonuclease-1 [Candidatus Thorarchaeota archaeon]
MGTKLAEIIEAQKISLSDLSGKKIAIDAFNTLYQFLSIIRQPDGTPLMDRKGRVTSHLSGLFYRNINLLEQGILPVYVFDGESPKLKSGEVARRREIRDAAYEEWQVAKKEGRIDDARKAAQASSRLTDSMVEESKTLLTAMGIPHIQAPSEGEALAAQMARDGSVWASASQDNDSLLYNCPRMIRNLSISGRRRVSRAKTFKTISPELIDLDLNLRLLGITREQLIDIAMLVGTDYNDKVPRVGQKTALKLVKEFGSIDGIVKDGKYEIEFPYDEIRDIFLNPPKDEIGPIDWNATPNIDEVTKILCSEHDFSVNRVKPSLERIAEKLEEIRGSSQQSTLSDFF